MTQNSVINDDLKALIGISGEPLIFKVEEGAILRFADAVGYPDTKHFETEDRKPLSRGRLLCPAGFYGLSITGERNITKSLASLFKAGAASRTLYGGVDFEFILPMADGDTLTAISQISSISEKDTSLGRTMFTAIRTEFINQDGNVAARCMETVINY